MVLCMVAEPDLVPVVARRRAEERFTVYKLNDTVLSPQPWNPVVYLCPEAGHAKFPLPSPRLLGRDLV